MVDPLIYRAEPDPEFADRLERLLLERLAAPVGPRRPRFALTPDGSDADTRSGDPAAPRPRELRNRRLVAGSQTRWLALEVPDPAHLPASTIDPPQLPAGRPLRRWVTLTAAAAAVVAVVVGALALASPSGDDLDVDGGTDFANAIEASGLLSSPSAEEAEEAIDNELYRPESGQTQVSAAGNFVSLRTCRFFEQAPDGGPSPACPDGFPAGWAYVAGTADGSVVHHGLLGQANRLDLSVLDDRYFVAESPSDEETPPTAWLIDAVSGQVGLLTWRDTPTTLRSPAQLLLVCEETSESCSVPRAVDAGSGTIQPLAVPDNVEPGLRVAQLGVGRIWVGTARNDGQLGLAYSDDGGETWADTALPEQMAATSQELTTSSSMGDRLLEIAADEERVAVAFSWRQSERDPTRDELFVSHDAGRVWTQSPSEPGGNGARLYVLADRRLVLLWSMDYYPHQLLVTSGTDWSALQAVDAPASWEDLSDDGTDRFTTNQSGVSLTSRFTHPNCDPGACSFPNAEAERLAALDRPIYTKIDFSTDLVTWRTVEGSDG